MFRRAALLLSFSACLSDGCRAEQPWPFWNSYADRMVDGQGRVVDHAAGDRTTSEGQAYGMFFALVANDRAASTTSFTGPKQTWLEAI